MGEVPKQLDEMAASRRRYEIGLALSKSLEEFLHVMGVTRYCSLAFTVGLHADPSKHGIMSIVEATMGEFAKLPQGERQSRRAKMERHPLSGNLLLLELMLVLDLEHSAGDVAHTILDEFIHALLHVDESAGMGRGDCTCVRLTGGGAMRILKHLGVAEYH